MKLNAWLISALASSTALSVLAQTPNPVPPPPALAAPVAPAVEPPAETAPKPAKEPKAKTKAKAKRSKAPAIKSSIFLNPPVQATVKCNVLDVRGQGSFAGEVISHLKKGESVTVLEELTLGHLRPNEPEQWSRIVLPTNTPVWVDADFIDAESKEVRVKAVNVRGGPGENYSILGRMEKGTAVKEINKKEGWLEIEPPVHAYAFVASEYLEKQATEPPALVAEAAPPPAVAPAPPPAPVVVNVPPAPVPPKAAEPPSVGLAAPAPTAASQADQELSAERRASAPPPLAAPPTPAPEAAPTGKLEVPRIVTREGFVHKSYNIQAPTDFELHDIKTGELIEYLQPLPSQKFKAYVGTRVRIVGTESLDPNWPRTPVLKIQTVDLMP
jgi:hypothetical protein